MYCLWVGGMGGVLYEVLCMGLPTSYKPQRAYKKDGIICPGRGPIPLLNPSE